MERNKIRFYRPGSVSIGCVIVFFCLSAWPVAALTPLSLEDLPKDPRLKAERIMSYIDDLWRGDSSRAKLTMTVHTEHWSRTLKMKAWSLGKDYSLIRILSPKKEAGTATLKYGNKIFNYLPKTDRTIKITSGMMMGSWMGSHFTNDDLVKESRFSEDYTFEVLFEGLRDGREIWEIQLLPKPDAAVVWGKIIFSITQKDFLPLQSIYFDEDGNRIRTMRFSGAKRMGNRLIPAIMRLTPDDGSGEYTELIYDSLEFNIGLKKAFFSLRNLKKQ